MNIVSQFRSLPRNTQRLMGLGGVLGLTIALPLFIWAVITQNFNVREKAQAPALIPISPSDFSVIVATDSAEVFNPNDVAIRFYETHTDNYDFLVIFNEFDYNDQFYSQFKNAVQGIGKPMMDDTLYFIPSIATESGKLLGWGNIGDISLFLSSEEGKNYFVYNAILEETIFHQFAVSVGDVQDSNSNLPLRNTLTSSHWTPCLSFFRIDPQKGYLKAQSWTESSNGSWTKQQRAIGQINSFDPFTLYLMGFLPPEKVKPDATLINPNGTDKSSQCAYNDTVSGTSSTVSVNDIVAVHGPRIPSYENSQKKYSFAFILSGRSGESIPQDHIDALNTWAQAFPNVLASALNYDYVPVDNETPTPSIGPTATATPVPGTPNSCGGTCGSNYNCKGGLFCFEGFCRNPECQSDKTCKCITTPTPTPSKKPTIKPTPTNDVVYLTPKPTIRPSISPVDTRPTATATPDVQQPTNNFSYLLWISASTLTTAIILAIFAL